ncbi:tetratricopeptide repeat protein [Streptomyces sp.]|uniref:tetratricopeptide repeat protein n=1 Tax=Streptomyces sp. TaxID=1931 RepID=UPI002F95278C
MRFTDALVPLRRGLDLVSRTGSEDLRARLMNNIAMSHVLLGQFDEAVDMAGQALALRASPWIEAYLLDTLGQAHTGLGAYDEAGKAHRTALDLIHDHGDRCAEPYALHHLGLAERGRGDTAEARSAWQTALRIMDEFPHTAWPNRPELLRLIAELDGQPAGHSTPATDSAAVRVKAPGTKAD